jgi:hypothetical protein
MKRVVLALAVLALALSPAALAGGFATVQLSSLPNGTKAGGTWQAHLLVLQHGRTPLDGLAPVIRIRAGDGVVKEFPAMPAGEPGRYDAEVTFPAAGTWNWEIWDGFSQTHTYSPVAIGTGSGGGNAWFPTVPVGAGAFVLALAGLVVLVARRRRASPRPALH